MISAGRQAASVAKVLAVSNRQIGFSHCESAEIRPADGFEGIASWTICATCRVDFKIGAGLAYRA
jgi:hypothetical protein